MMDHSRHARLGGDELTEAVLIGTQIYGPGDEKIGIVAEVHGIGMESHVVADVGGFLGIGAKPVAIATRDLDFMRDENGTVHAMTSWTKEQVKALPDHSHHH